MNRKQKKALKQNMDQKKASAIIDGTQDDFRQDGYTNMLNKFGTSQDNSTAYRYVQGDFVNDFELIKLYESNGLFSKIIDRPSEEAVKHGFDIDYGDLEIREYVEEIMDDLSIEENFATAEKWARLYGGSIIIMLCDDNRGLEEPLDWNEVRKIEELKVFERSVVEPDYTSMQHHIGRTMDPKQMLSQGPEFYQVSSMYGYFKVHRSRCLVFRNGRLPEHTTNAIYRHWGLPEYAKIKDALRECIVSHETGVKMMDRSVQAIYKMKNLANLLGTSDGEDKVIQRLQIIDMARGILNSIAIDTDGEDYDFKNFSLSGVKEVIDATCNMLSAVCEIPQTILFGRSPAGMNSTGEADMENYYNMVERIQKQNMKGNAKILIDLILHQLKYEGKIEEIPKYKVEFAPLWSISDTEQSQIEQAKASTEQTKAQTAQIYIDSGVVDPTEVRRTLAREGTFEIEDILTEEDLDLPEDMFDLGEGDNPQSEEGIPDKTDEDNGPPPASAVLIIKDGEILCADRSNNEGICGPGGKSIDGETPEETVVREAIEEFNVLPLNLIPLGVYKDHTGQYLDCMMYFTDHFSGKPKADGIEMLNERWMSIEELRQEVLFPPFSESLKLLENLLLNDVENGIVSIQNTTDGGPGSGRYPKGSGGGFKGKYDKAIKGIETSDGKEVKEIDPHLYKRAGERKVYPNKIAKALKEGETKEGNTGDRTVYIYKGTHVVFDNETSTVKTVIYKGKKSKAKSNAGGDKSNQEEGGEQSEGSSESTE